MTAKQMSQYGPDITEIKPMPEAFRALIGVILAVGLLAWVITTLVAIKTGG